MFFKTGALLVILNLVGCYKDELPKPIKSEQTVNIVSVNIGNEYGNQLFYNLKEREIVKMNHREEWDLAFESGTNGFHVILNGAKVMAAQQTSQTDLADVSTVQGDAWKWDVPSGNLDSTAIGDWRTNDLVYLIDRGTSTAGIPLGKIKLKIMEVDAQKYQIEWGTLTGSIVTSIIPKNEETNFSYFSFSTNSVVDIEPPKSKWDLCFTSFTHIFDEHTPYSVVGVLTNRYKTKSATFHEMAFSAISYVDYLVANFESRINTIGYSWKKFDFETNLYVVDVTQNFLVETSEERVFKLRFLDFYDDFGVKGSPKMEIQEIIP